MPDSIPLPIIKLYPDRNTPSDKTEQNSNSAGTPINFGANDSNTKAAQNPKALDRITPNPEEIDDRVKPKGGKFVSIPLYKVDPFIPEPYKTDRVIGTGRALSVKNESSKNRTADINEDFVKIENPTKEAIDIINNPSNTIASLSDLRRMYSVLKSLPQGTYEYEKLRSVYEQANNQAAIIRSTVNEDNVTTLKNLFSSTDFYGRSIIFKPSNLYIETDEELTHSISQNSFDNANTLVNQVINLPQEERMPYISTIFSNTPENKRFTGIYFLASLNKKDPSFLSNFAKCDLETQDLIMKKLLGEYAYDHKSTEVKASTTPQTGTASINPTNKGTTTFNINAAEKTAATQTPAKSDSKTVTNQELFELYNDLQTPGESESSNRSPWASWYHRTKNNECDMFIAHCMYQIASPNEIKYYYDMYKFIDPDKSAPRALRGVLRNQIELSWGIQGNIAHTQDGKVDAVSTLNNFKNNIQVNNGNELVFNYKSRGNELMTVSKTFDKTAQSDYFDMSRIDNVIKMMNDLPNSEKAKIYLAFCKSQGNDYINRPLTQYERIALFNKLANSDPYFISECKYYEKELLYHLLGKYSTN